MAFPTQRQPARVTAPEYPQVYPAALSLSAMISQYFIITVVTTPLWWTVVVISVRSGPTGCRVVRGWHASETIPMVSANRDFGLCLDCRGNGYPVRPMLSRL